MQVPAGETASVAAESDVELAAGDVLPVALPPTRSARSPAGVGEPLLALSAVTPAGIALRWGV